MRNYTLPQQFKDDWMEALTSGHYSKIEGMLYDSSKNNCGYCAVGVALNHCLNIDKEHLDRQLTVSNIVEQTHLLEKELAIPWLFNRDVEYDDSVLLDEEIMGLNDEDDFTFEEIAGWIDTNVQGV